MSVQDEDDAEWLDKILHPPRRDGPRPVPQEARGTGSFRADLDLSGFLDRYAEGLGHQAVNFIEEGRVVERDPSHDPIPSHLYKAPRQPGEGDEPEAVGDGPLRASTSRVLATAYPLFAWDPNRYYRDLGIPWPYVDATRTALRQAYVAAGGPNNEWLTYCFKQLLNPLTRDSYDRTPLGKEFLDDVFVQERKKREAQDRADALNAADGGNRTWGDVMDSEGDHVRLTPEEEAEIERLKALDAERRKNQDPSVGGPWEYSFYLWRTTTYDRDVLREWQEALVRQIDGRLPTVTVGMMGNQPHRFAIAEIGDEIVLFLNRDKVASPDLVEAATTALLNSIR